VISPPALVWVIAWAKVRHGAVRAHELVSTPWPETNVRLVWADAGETMKASAAVMAIAIFLIGTPKWARRAEGVLDKIVCQFVQSIFRCRVVRLFKARQSPQDICKVGLRR
jgi:hypothetical protein